MAISHIALNAIESPVLRRPVGPSRAGIFSRNHPHSPFYTNSRMMKDQSLVGRSSVGSSPLAVDSQDEELIRDAMAWCAQHGLVRGACLCICMSGPWLLRWMGLCRCMALEQDVNWYMLHLH